VRKPLPRIRKYFDVLVQLEVLDWMYRGTILTGKTRGGNSKKLRKGDRVTAGL